MYRISRHIAVALALMFGALIAACPLVACTQQAAAAETPKHACCPKAPRPVEPHSKSAADCPVLMPELRAGLVKDKVRLAPLGVVAPDLPTLVLPQPAIAVHSPEFEQIAPNERELFLRIRVLRI